MDTLTKAKLALTLMAAILFAGSMRVASADWLRWVAIALLVAALLLRFVGPRRGRRDGGG